MCQKVTYIAEIHDKVHPVTMDPFTTPQRSKESDVSQFQIFSKADVINFLKSFDFSSIAVPQRYSTSSDEDCMAPFLQSFFNELSKAVFKSSPPKASPKKLLSMAYVFGDGMRSNPYVLGDETPTKQVARPTKQTANLQQTSPAFPDVGHAVTDADSAIQSFPSTPSETTMSPSLPITPAEPEAPINSNPIPSMTSRAKRSAPSPRMCLLVDNLDPTVTGGDLYKLFGRNDVAFVNSWTVMIRLVWRRVAYKFIPVILKAVCCCSEIR